MLVRHLLVTLQTSSSTVCPSNGVSSRVCFERGLEEVVFPSWSCFTFLTAIVLGIWLISDHILERIIGNNTGLKTPLSLLCCLVSETPSDSLLCSTRMVF